MNVFISYRRADDRFAVGRIRDVIASVLGDSCVFLDVLSVETGANFEEVIESKIAASDVVLVVIGDRWEAARRESAEIDYVEIEVGVALANGKRVIPVLIGSREMPEPHALSGSLEKLRSINAFRVRADPDFRSDTEALMRVIGAPDSAGLSGVSSSRRRRWRLIGAALTATVLLAAGAAMRAIPSDEARIVAPATTVASPTSVIDSSTGVPTTSLAPEALYPISPAELSMLFADSIDELPEIAVEVEGYGAGRGERSDVVRVFQGEDTYVPEIFIDWAVGNSGCNRVWWIARWQSANPDVVVHAELVPADVLFGYSTVRPEQQSARAGYLSGDGCAVMGLWFGEALNGNTSNLVDIEYQVQVFDVDGFTRPDCSPTVVNEAIPLALCDEGESVRKVQQALIDLGIANVDLVADGRFLASTESAIKVFQLRADLPIDGIVTTSTWKLLLPDDPVPTG